MGRQRKLHMVPGRQAPALKIEKLDFTDGDKLAWEQMRAPMQATLDQAAAAAQHMQGVVAGLLLNRMGLDPKEGWRVNVEKLRYEKHPVPEEVS